MAVPCLWRRICPWTRRPQGSHRHACIAPSKTTLFIKSMWSAYNNDSILGKWVTSTISLLRDAPFNTASNRITGTHVLIRRNKLHTFSPNMFQGKVRAALRILTNESKGGSLPIDARLSTHPDQPIPTVCDKLLKNHPLGQTAHPDALISSTTPRPVTHPVVFDCLDGASIDTAALHTNGSAGPSGIDSTGWRRLCTSFQKASADLATV